MPTVQPWHDVMGMILLWDFQFEEFLWAVSPSRLKKAEFLPGDYIMGMRIVCFHEMCALVRPPVRSRTDGCVF